MKKKFSYIAFMGKNVSFGVLKKLQQTTESIKNEGYEVKLLILENNFYGLLKSIKYLVKSKDELVLIRFYDLFMLFLFPFLLWRRFFIGINILDIPTPRYVFLKELKFDGKSFVHIFFRRFLNYFQGFFVTLPFNRVVQYASESLWFSFFEKNKTIKMGNGIYFNADKSTVFDENEMPSDNELRLVAVATIAYWHGYDRLIRAIKLFKENNPEKKIKLKIIGSGKELDALKELTESLELDDIISLPGPLFNDDLSKVFYHSDVGVSSLGLSRKGLVEAADLKTREYMAHGLCVLGSGEDPDFAPNCELRFLVPNDESIDPIYNMLLDLHFRKCQKSLPSKKNVLKFAINNLSLSSKVKKILSI